MKKGIIVLFLIIGFGCSSQKNILDLGYGSYADLNPLLTITANSVVRTSENILEVWDTQKSVYTVREAITILDEEHADLSTLVVPYDQLSKINSMKANLYDKHGTLLRSYSMEDAADYSDYDGFSFFTDNRVKVLELYSSSYPYTIEYEYVVTHESILNLPTWFPQITEQSIEKSTFTLIDHSTGVRFHQKNYEEEPVVKDTLGAKMYTWETDFVLSKDREPFGPNYRDVLPHILFAPGVFEMDNIIGKADSWKDFGKWYYQMSAGTRELPVEAQTEIDRMIAGVTNEEEIVSILFNHLQDKNRYVSIQLGVGGWKPFPAEYVFENSYGDCKALTNYMQAMLEHVGIKADAVLIRANGVPEMIEEFPSNQFNHVILRVTLSNGKVIWLECTSKYLPPNNLGDGQSIKALLVTEEGGVVVETPQVDYFQNQLKNSFVLNIKPDGSAFVDAEITNTGVNQGSILHRLLRISERERLEWLERSIPVNNRKVESYDFTRLKDSPTNALYTYTATLGNYANASSKRIYVPINKMNKWTLFIPEEESRTQPIEFRYPFSEVDSTVFVIPEEFDVEFMPESTTQESSFGEYTVSFEKIGDREFLLRRFMAIRKPSIEPENYDELRGFLDGLRKADSQQMVLVKSETE